MKSRMKDTLLLVGNEGSDRGHLHSIFESRYYLLESETAAQGALLLAQNKDCIAAVIADLTEEDFKNLPTLVEASRGSSDMGVPVICVVTVSRTKQLSEERAFLMGATDVVRRPYTPITIQQRVQILVDFFHQRLSMEQLVEDQNKVILNANQTILDTLSALLEHRSIESGNHILRIRQLTKILLQEIARCYPEYKLTENDIDCISSASALHDIGKISIPDAILNKPGKLTEEEFSLMKTHTTLGSQMVEHLGDLGDMVFLRYAYNICLYHHERWDGKGYPTGIAGENIPICAQVVGLADVFDALTSPRVYKDAIGYEKACNMIFNGECGEFSPKVLECFKQARHAMVQKARQYADGLSPKSEQIRMPLPDPLHQIIPLNALQLSQLKYQSLLHYVNDTVIELDIDNQVFHVVHNPNPDFVSLFLNANFQEVFHRLLEDGVHPEDVPIMQRALAEIREKLFEQNQRKFKFRCRIYDPLKDQFHPYDIIAMRVNTDNPAQRILLAVFHNVEDLPVTSERAAARTEIPELHELVDCLLCCNNNTAQSIQRGANTLLHLTGYTPRQIKERFGDSLRNLVYEDDRDSLDSLLQQLQTENMGQTQLRILRSTNEPVWVMVKSRIHFTDSGEEYVYHVLTDISEIKQNEQLFRSDVQRHQYLTQLSEAVVFEWDIHTHIFSCSSRWKERFGYDINGSTIRPDLSESVYIHPDDIRSLQQAVRTIQESRNTGFVDIRIANSESRYLWSRVRAAIRYNPDNDTEYLVGLIYDIHDLKVAALDMQQQAQVDDLTKLLNKAFTQRSVTEYLRTRSTDTLAALLMLDMDNFKTVNDTYGHLYGDAVLARFGATLRTLFRPSDVVGRIGGDEFLILMKDIPNLELVEDRCRLLVDTFRDRLHQLMPDLNVSISVGAVLICQESRDYDNVFHQVDEALYIAKSLGKCQYHIHTGQDNRQTAPEDLLCITQIDSDERTDTTGDYLLRFAFSKLYNSRDLDASVNELLAIMGNHFDVSRVYVFENNADNTTCSNTFEWCNQGIEPQIAFLQNISYETDVPGWADVYNEKGILYCTNIQELEPAFRKILEPQGIKSMLHCTIMDQGVFRGYVGFDECTANHHWTPGQIKTLEYLAQILGVFLLKRQNTPPKTPKKA